MSDSAEIVAVDAERDRRPARFFLRWAKADRFGCFEEQTLGPLCPGFNLIYGPNETGKTTWTALIGGVLFGWDEGRGQRRRYEPRQGKRSGSLIFSARETPANLSSGAISLSSSARAVQLTRSGDAELKGDEKVLDDMDRATFRTLFSLTSDELRSLRRGPDLVANLLTVDAGMRQSPARLAAAIDERIATLVDPQNPQSLPCVTQRRSEIRASLDEALAERRELLVLTQEGGELDAERQSMAARLAEVDKMLDRLQDCESEFDRIDKAMRELDEEDQALADQEKTARARQRALEEEIGPILTELKPTEERALRAQIEAMQEDLDKLESGLDMARRHLSESEAAFELAQEAAGDETSQTDEASEGAGRRLQLGVTAALCAVLAAIGVPLFLYGRGLGSLTVTALGLVLVFVAVVMGVSTVILAFRPPAAMVRASAPSPAQRVKDAQWVARQDRNRVAAIKAEMAELQGHIDEQLTSQGLGAAHGSLRQAKKLLDEAREARGDLAQASQREQAAIARRSENDQRRAELKARRIRLAHGASLPVEATSATARREVERRREQRAHVQTAADQLGERAEGLAARLDAAAADRSFDELKLQNQILKARIKDTTADLARLLLAKRQLSSALAVWGGESQPEIYAQAGEILSLMTGGRWRAVRLRADGRLAVSDGDGERESAQLSLGTLQQLYLALRLALLKTATQVGRSMPVLADDILVHFDRERQIGAIRALGQLALQRQVIFLTCHPEIRDAVKSTLATWDGSFKSLDLSQLQGS